MIITEKPAAEPEGPTDETQTTVWSLPGCGEPVLTPGMFLRNGGQELKNWHHSFTPYCTTYVCCFGLVFYCDEKEITAFWRLQRNDLTLSFNFDRLSRFTCKVWITGFFSFHFASCTSPFTVKDDLSGNPLSLFLWLTSTSSTTVIFWNLFPQQEDGEWNAADAQPGAAQAGGGPPGVAADESPRHSQPSGSARRRRGPCGGPAEEEAAARGAGRAGRADSRGHPGRPGPPRTPAWAKAGLNLLDYDGNISNSVLI